MRQTLDKSTENLAERRCWAVAHRDDSRVARRLYRQQAIEGVDRLDEGAVLDDFFHCLQAVGVMALLEQSQGAAIPREMIAFAPYVLRHGVKTLCGIASMKALPSWLCSDEARMPLVGCKAQQGRQGICQRGGHHAAG